MDNFSAIQQVPDWNTNLMAAHDGLHLSESGSRGSLRNSPRGGGSRTFRAGPAGRVFGLLACLSDSKPHFFGCFEVLSEVTLDAKGWCVMQYHRPKEADGTIVALSFVEK